MNPNGYLRMFSYIKDENKMKLKQLLFLSGILLLLLHSCSNDDEPNLPDDKVNAPSFIQISTTDSKATISGKADADCEVTLKYNVATGQVLRQVKSDASGGFTTNIDLLVDYEQELIAFATKDNQVSETVMLDNIPAKVAYSVGWNTAKEIMLAHRWKSDQTVSRIIIKQTSASPPYDLFATIAQKYFDFKANGDFHFEVTTPLQFTHSTGSWSMGDKGVIEINTMIPLGAMQITDAKIQHLDSERLSLLAKISDGLFLLSFTSNK